MKRKIILVVAVLGMVLSTGCGTIWGGQITEHQKRKPAQGKREIRPIALAGDILFFPVLSIPIDFATGGIYRPLPKK